MTDLELLYRVFGDKVEEWIEKGDNIIYGEVNGENIENFCDLVEDIGDNIFEVIILGEVIRGMFGVSRKEIDCIVKKINKDKEFGVKSRILSDFRRIYKREKGE